jgi:hypothetical protein
MLIEDEAMSTIWTMIAAAVISFIVLPIIATSLFKWINSSLHPMYEIISKKIEEEKNPKETTEEQASVESPRCLQQTTEDY